MENKKDFLSRLHSVEIEILKVVDDFCRKNDIKYSLYCGTMLGAVRHKGFIPWDDDIDLCMERQDYDRFIKLWNESNNKDFILQNKDTDEDFTQSFTKIRKNNTCFLQRDEQDKLYHKGIFVDILPLDRFPNNKLSQVFFKLDTMIYQLFTREFVPKNSSVVVTMISNLMLKLFRGGLRRKIRKFFLKKMMKYQNDLNCSLVSANSMDGFNHIMPADMPQRMNEYLFENAYFMGYSDYDGMLKSWYRNYMQLPPIEEQVWKHQPEVIDFENNYKEVL
ncbi:lipopolysaccharide cholinephosphotransferase [Fibrobacter sp. UWOV1]|uniref:LicD family protein n=1 Tax=Fibrobacter sp. UWOV1 TaxID=1896215 RepID=UPI0009145E6A|nr:LicD family protein [Fibrobacter sp. UWOV1]SHL85677.1 lipopolysaccharide cholinephosphotransferase [Fibrobacter sp. UWOV1]